MKRMLLGATMLLLMAGAVTGCGSWWFTGGVVGNQNNFYGRASACTVKNISAESGWVVERMDAAYYANGNVFPYVIRGNASFVAMFSDFHYDLQEVAGHQLWNQAPVGGNGTSNGAQVLIGIYPNESFHPGFAANSTGSIANLSSRIEISDSAGNRSVINSSGEGCELRNDP